MDKLYFGTAGVPHSSQMPRSTLDGIRRVGELGLGCMELEFVQRVSLGQAGAKLVAEVAEECGIKLSAHAPYYINFNAHEPEKIDASKGRLLQAARIGHICGALSVVVHTSFYLGDAPEDAYQQSKKHLQEVVETLRSENNPIRVRPELMGKPTQFGDLGEIMRLSKEIEGISPCVDFAHLHARTGAYNTLAEFKSVLADIESVLGRSALDDMHIHFSGINYGAKGEKNHLNFAEADFNYADLLRAFKEYDIKGLVVCESPNLEEDALLLQNTYRSL